MRILSYNMPANWNYFLFGDSHIGAALRFDKGFHQMVGMMLSRYDGIPAKYNFGTDHGDFCEAILVDDKRFSIFDSREACVLSQLEMAKKEYWPIRRKMVCMLDGNHPEKLHRYGPLTHYLCKQLGVSYGTTSAKIVFKNKDKLQFKHYAIHGKGSVKSVADDPETQKHNMRKQLKRKLKNKWGDCLLNSMGHTHLILVSHPTENLYLTDDGKKISQNYTGAGEGPYIHPDYRWYVNTGGFLKLYSDTVVESDDVPIEDSKLGSGYTEKAMYDPLVLGFLVAKIRDNKLQDVVVETL